MAYFHPTSHRPTALRATRAWATPAPQPCPPAHPAPDLEAAALRVQPVGGGAAHVVR